MEQHQELAKQMATNLAAILQRYDEHCAEREPWDTITSTPINSSDLMQLPPRWKSAIESVERDPVRFALRAEAREIGWKAYAIGGLDFMRHVFEMAEAQWEGTWRGSVFDKWWDGIGTRNLWAA